MANNRTEQAIPTLIDDWTDAICKGDIDRVLANRTDDIVMYDVPEPIQVKGIDAYKDMWKLFFEHNAAGPDRFRLSDVQVVAGDDIAYAHGLRQSAAATPIAVSPSGYGASMVHGR